MPLPLAATISIGLHSLALLLYSTTMLPIPWYSFKYQLVSLHFSLYSCLSCMQPFTHMSPGCFDATLCGDGMYSGLCAAGGRLQQGSDVYFYAAAGCILLLVLNLERLLAMVCRRDYGHPVVMKTLIPVPVLIGTFALVSWFAYIQPEFNCPYTSPVMEPCVSMEAGAFLALLAYTASIGASASFITAVCHRNPEFDKGVTGIGNGTILAFTYRNWLLAKIVPILGVSVGFTAVSLSLPWVNFQQSDTFYRGDLVKMIDGLPNHKEEKYECLWGWTCANQTKKDDQMICNAFERMSAAGRMYVGIKAAAFLSLVLWVESLVYFILHREFFFPSVVSAYAPLTLSLHIFAVLSWFVTVHATLNDDCQVSSEDTDITFCVDNGASFTIWEALSLFFAVVFYEVLYCKRWNTLQQTSPDGEVVDCEVGECSPKVKEITTGCGLESPTNQIFPDDELIKKPTKIEEGVIDTHEKLDITDTDIADTNSHKPGTAPSSAFFTKANTIINSDAATQITTEQTPSDFTVLKQELFCSKCHRT